MAWSARSTGGSAMPGGRAQNNRRDDHVQSVKATCRKEA
jgi:hypothetical protein